MCAERDIFVRKKTYLHREHVNNRGTMGDNKRGVQGGVTKYTQGITTCLTTYSHT